MRFVSILVVVSLLLVGCGQREVVVQQLQVEPEVLTNVVECEDVTFDRTGENLRIYCVLQEAVTITPTGTSVPSSTPTFTPTLTSTSTPTPTFTSSTTPTASPTLRVVTATLTLTPTPTKLVVVTPGAPSTPFVGAPSCDHSTSETMIRWHGLWDAERGCHYDHTHHWNPDIVNDIFGDVVDVLGQEISYPWATLNENLLSPFGKHEGYRYSINRDLPCQFDFASELERREDVYCVRAFRIQHHNHDPKDILVRFHSFYAEMLICTRDNSNCWILRTGGWSDIGHLMAPYKTERIILSTDPANVQFGVEGYRAYNRDVFGGIDFLARYRVDFRSCKGCPEIRNISRNSTNDNVSYWATMKAWSSLTGYNVSAGFIEWTYDTSSLVHYNPPTDTVPSTVLICPDGRCRFNGSEAQVYQVAGVVHPSLDPDGDGWVRGGFKGWTNRKGELVDTCRTVGLDCIPYEIVGDAKVGMGVWSNQQNLGYSTRQPDGTIGVPEFDVSPGTEWWIVPHNH